MTRVYTQPQYPGSAALKAAIASDDVDVLGEMIIGAALYEEDFDVVQAACIQLSGHQAAVIRGNAVLGLGHIARGFERLDAQAVELVRLSLRDSSVYVRRQAYAAAGDLEHFLGIDVGRDEPLAPAPDG